MTRAWLVALAAMLAAQGCAAGVTAGGGLRVEQVAPSMGLPQQGIRAESRVTVTRPLGPSVVALSAAPMAVAPLDAATTARAVVRGALNVSRRARGAMQPTLTLGVEQGTTRPSDLSADVLEPIPARATLTSARVTADARLAWRRSGRHTIAMSLANERSRGLGDDAAVLPALSRDALRLHSAWRVSARSSLSLVAGVEQSGLERAAPWRAVSGATQWTRRAADGVTVGVELGAVASASGSALRVATRIQRPATPARLGLDLSAEQGPELDRLDGSVRLRRRARVSFETPHVSAVSFRGSLQGFADWGRAAARRGLGGEVVVQQRLREFGRLEMGMARLVLWEGQGAARGETRLSAGLRILEPTSRCRSSC